MNEHMHVYKRIRIAHSLILVLSPRQQKGCIVPAWIHLRRSVKQIQNNSADCFENYSLLRLNPMMHRACHVRVVVIVIRRESEGGLNSRCNAMDENIVLEASPSFERRKGHMEGRYGIRKISYSCQEYYDMGP